MLNRRDVVERAHEPTVVELVEGRKLWVFPTRRLAGPRGRQAWTHAVVDLCSSKPFAQRLISHAELLCDRLDRAAHSDGYPCRCPSTIRPARSRTSGGYLPLRAIESILPKIGISTFSGAVQVTVRRNVLRSHVPVRDRRGVGFSSRVRSAVAFDPTPVVMLPVFALLYLFSGGPLSIQFLVALVAAVPIETVRCRKALID